MSLCLTTRIRTGQIRTGALAGALAAQMLLAPAAGAATTLTLSNWLPPKHVIVAEMMVPWINAVKKATEGRIEVKILPKPLGKPPAHYDIAREGTADLTYGIHGYQPGRFLLTSVTEMPFLGNDAEHISLAYWRTYEKLMAKAGEHRDVKLLGLFTHGPGHIMNVKSKEITALSQLKDMKMRIGGGIVKQVTANFGIAQMFMPAPAVYEALTRGVADGVMFPLEAIDGFKLEKTVTNVTRIDGGLYNTSFFFVMNKARWESLSAADRSAIDSVSGPVFSQLAGKAFQARDIAGEKKLLANGGTITNAPAAMLDKIRGFAAGVEAGWAKQTAKKGVDGAAALAAMRAEIKKLAGQ
ncbi:MAG: ABC transporter substrate-binding protein [Gammaproteobacteria bacterium]|nr:ABC transporter substrate-binding protein [Gammaproteobacteria bacterium]